MNMKRLFTAIKIHPDACFIEQLGQLKAQLCHERIKWVEEHNIHITLKFFGETDEKMCPEIEKVLNLIANQHLAFDIRLEKLGIFGSRYDPKVIWAGIDPYNELVSLMQKIHKSLEPLGFMADRQNLIPHLTLGRIKELQNKMMFQKTIDRFTKISSEKMLVNDFILYQSILKTEGPIYIALNTFSLIK